MSDLDLRLHSRGESRFVADLPEPEGTLRAAVLASPVAHGRITRLDVSRASGAEGVAAVLTASDIPGENQIGTLVLDEPLLAGGSVHYAGQPVAAAFAATERQARAARGRGRRPGRSATGSCKAGGSQGPRSTCTWRRRAPWPCRGRAGP